MLKTSRESLVVAEVILSQLGGNKFVAMTGSKNFISDKNTLRMDLVSNKSKANKLWITLQADDTYTMKFFKFTKGKLNTKTYEWKEEQSVDIRVANGVYFDMLQDIFTDVTGLYTHL